VLYHVLITAIIAINAITGYILKRIAKFRRPLYVFGDKIHIFSEKYYKYSLPSAHTQIAFCVATLLNYQFHRYGWLFYSVASLIGIYRVCVGVHFPSDIVIGAIMGFVILMSLV